MIREWETSSHIRGSFARGSGDESWRRLLDDAVARPCGESACVRRLLLLETSVGFDEMAREGKPWKKMRERWLKHVKLLAGLQPLDSDGYYGAAAGASLAKLTLEFVQQMDASKIFTPEFSASLEAWMARVKALEDEAAKQAESIDEGPATKRARRSQASATTGGGTSFGADNLALVQARWAEAVVELCDGFKKWQDELETC